jgi:flagellar biosynthetic protein FliR
MEAILDSVSLRLDLFILMFIRVSALIISSPIFGRKTLPRIIKVCLSLTLTYVMFAANLSTPQPVYDSIMGFAMLCVKELLFGLVLGFVMTMFFSLVQISGHYIDMQMGFGMVNVLDVQSQTNVPITSDLLGIVLTLTFFGVNGHLKLVYILNSTFAQIPVGTVTLNPLIGMAALEVFALTFLLAVHVALPLIASGLLGEVTLGFITRAVPQVNVFVVGIPIKVVLGFMMLLLVLPVYVSFTDVIFERMFESIGTMIAGMAA